MVAESPRRGCCDGCFIELRQTFGTKFLWFVFAGLHLVKGMVTGITLVAWPYILKKYNVSASRAQTYLGVRSLPWALKPAIGLFSDTCPIWGYTRFPYLMMASCLGVTSLMLLAILRKSLQVHTVVWLLFLVSLYKATVDLLAEAIYTSKLRSTPSLTPYMVAFVWGGITVMGAVGMGLGGILLFFGCSPWFLYAIAIFPASVVLFATLLNWNGEQRLTERGLQEQRQRVYDQREAVFLAVILVLAALILMGSGMLLDVTSNAIVSLMVAVFVIFFFSVLLNPVIAKVNAFVIFQASLSISLESAAFYFCTDTKEEFENGPHFDPLFYNAVLPLCGSAFALLGIWGFNSTAHLLTYQQLYFAGNLVISVISSLDVMFFLRLNRDWGIPDHAFILGASAIDSLVNEFLWMPSIALVTQLCPKGMEAIMFANLASCHNLGVTMSKNFGALLLNKLGVEPRGNVGEDEEFDNLWIASLVTCLLPLLVLWMVPFFIPNKLSTERVLPASLPSNHGSYFQQWAARDKDSDEDKEKGTVREPLSNVGTSDLSAVPYGSLGQSPQGTAHEGIPPG